MNKDSLKYIAIFAVSISLIILPCVVLLITGIATPFLSGFAVDDRERIYIGGTQEIYVFYEGTQQTTIDPQTSRSYAFTITEDGKILLSTSTKVYLMDLDGTVQSEYEDIAADVYNQIKYRSHKYTTTSGDVYEMKAYLGWTHIVKNGLETVYRISFLSFVVKLLIFVSVISLIIFPIYFTIKFYRKT